ncbi:MAG: hypothetical protein ABIQ09_07055 [Jatrophihabitantaceae bacterium]
MSRLLRPAVTGIAFLLTCGILGSANPAFADKSAKLSINDKVAGITVTDDKVAGITVTDDKVAVITVTDDKVAGITVTDDKVA